MTSGGKNYLLISKTKQDRLQHNAFQGSQFTHSELGAQNDEKMSDVHAHMNCLPVTTTHLSFTTTCM